jgi:CubicO group peptidase (beta-lactamase class C family)
MDALREAVDREAERTGFSGAVRVDRSDETVLAAAYGFADRGHAIPNTPTFTVVSNWLRGAWPIVRLLVDRLGGEKPTGLS